MQVRVDVSAQQGEEARDGEGFVAVPADFVVDRVPVVEEGDERDDGVDRDHRDDPEDAVERWVGC